MTSFRNVFLLAVIKHIAKIQKNQRKTHTHTKRQEWVQSEYTIKNETEEKLKNQICFCSKVCIMKRLPNIRYIFILS